MTEHLPIQRWTKIFTRYPASEVLPNENGEYVTYADHLAALRACEQWVREDEQSSNFPPDDHSDGMNEAYRIGLDAAREAVAALPDLADAGFTYSGLLHRAAAIAAIDALREGDRPVTHDPLCYRSHDQPLGRDPFCQCEILRACEQRAREEQCSTCCTRAEQQYVTEFNAGHDQGYKDGYGAAMEDGWGGASNERTPGPIVKIDRWGASGRTGLPDTMPNGEWVKYRDHLEAVNACQQEAIDEAIKRVEALLFPWPNTWPGMIRRGDVIAAIKGQTERQSEEETQ